jgi:hypothetical protein
MKGRVMWLYHLLPKDLPNTRIMTYGYNSNLVKDASMGRIRDFAKGLLNAVDSYREREVDANIVISQRLLTKGFYSFRIGIDPLFLSVIA